MREQRTATDFKKEPIQIMLNYNLTVDKADIYPGYVHSRVTDGLNEVKHVIREISRPINVIMSETVTSFDYISHTVGLRATYSCKP